MGRINDRWYRVDKATGEKVPSSRHGVGKRWQAVYLDPAGKEHRPAFAKKVDAENELRRQEGDVLRGSWVDPKAGQITVRRFALDVWLPAQRMKGRTRAVCLSALEHHVFPAMGDRPINSVRPSQVLAWQASLAEKGSARLYNTVGEDGQVDQAPRALSSSFQARVVRHVRSIFRLAVVDRVIAVSPFEQVRAVASPEADVHPPDVAQVRELVATAYHERWAAMIELCALTGLRSGEVRGLTVDRIDFLRGRARIDRQLVYEAPAEDEVRAWAVAQRMPVPPAGQRVPRSVRVAYKRAHLERILFFDDLKTEGGKRVLPLTKRAVELLAAYLRRFPAPAAGPWAGLVFTMPGGLPVEESTWAYALEATCKAAGLGPWSPHDLRHHYASVLIGGGEQPKVVQKRLGHKDVTTTLRIYSHFWADAEERTRDVLDAAWEIPESDVKRTSDGPRGR